MKKILTIFVVILPFFAFSQAKYYQDSKGKILNENEYFQKKQVELENIQNKSGKSYDAVYEDLNLKSSSQDSIIYTYRLVFGPKEMIVKFKKEKEKQEKLKNTRFVIRRYFDFLKSEDKKKLDLSKPTFIYFWVPESDETTTHIALNELQETYGDKVNFVSVTFATREQVKEYLRTHKFNFIHIVDQKGSITKELELVNYPTYFILDKDQKIKFIKNGDIPSEKTNEALYKTAMKQLGDTIAELL